jgi:hypothetical protein
VITEATENAHTPAQLIGKLVAEVATWCCAEPGDLCAAHGMVRWLVGCSVRAVPWLDLSPAGWAESGRVKAGAVLWR